MSSGALVRAPAGTQTGLVGPVRRLGERQWLLPASLRATEGQSSVVMGGESVLDEGEERSGRHEDQGLVVGLQTRPQLLLVGHTGQRPPVRQLCGRNCSFKEG